MTDYATRALDDLGRVLAGVLPELRRAVEVRARRNAEVHAAGLAALCITEHEARARLAEVETAPAAPAAARDVSAPPRSERAAGRALPLEELQTGLGLWDREVEALALIAAAELDEAYARLFAYLADQAACTRPTARTLIDLLASGATEAAQLRRALGPLGRLVRTGLIEPQTIAHQEVLRITPLGLDAVLGSCREPASLFRDPEEVRWPGEPADYSPRARRLCHAVASGALDVVGVFGGEESDRALVVRAIAGAIAVRRPENDAASRALADAARRARAAGAVLWIELARFGELTASLREALEAAISLADRVILSGASPWRPAAALDGRSFAEIAIDPPALAARERLWDEALPELAPELRRDFASHLAMGRADVERVASVVRASRRLDEDDAAPTFEVVAAACQLVSQRDSHRFATVIRPRRGPSDLVLPPELHDRVLEVARFHRSWPAVAEDWGFGRMVTGRAGVKALFTGDSGTGKTLAAEVIAHELGLLLVRVDLAQIVSKWVGETERNLEVAFSEAERSHSLLFFDEADALFGKRGEVRYGTDRYANLEVSYLLQRLEDHPGLVILASNLNENIDGAFRRRFTVSLHFPRPRPKERERIWALAFPDGAPLDPSVRFDRLAKLDMTGAAIVGAGRTAALLARARGGATIDRDTVLEAIGREFEREGRFFSADAELFA